MKQLYVAIKNNKVYPLYDYQMLFFLPECKEIESVEERIAVIENNGYIVDTFAHYYQENISKEVIIMDSKNEFSNLYQAAAFLLDNGMAKTSPKTVASYITRVLNGRIKKYLGHTFEYQKKKYDINYKELELVFNHANFISE